MAAQGPPEAAGGDLCSGFRNLQTLEALPPAPLCDVAIPGLLPSVVRGTLENGLSYYVLPNREPVQRAEVHGGPDRGSPKPTSNICSSLSKM